MSLLTTANPIGVVLLALHAATALTAASHALLYKRDPRSAWGWIAACWLLPLGGAVLYYIFGINRVQQKALRLLGPGTAQGLGEAQVQLQLPSLPNTDPCELRELVRIATAMTGLPLSFGNHIEPLHNGEQAYPAMLAAIAAAQHSVYLCTYIFEAGAVADRFTAALLAAAQRGLTVRVLVDGWSDLLVAGAGWKRLSELGVVTTQFLPLRFWPLRVNLNLRNHRKLLVIDGSVAYTGGINIRDAHMLLPQRSEAIADLHFGVRGPVVAQLEECFISDWAFAADETLTRSPAAAEFGKSACRAIADGPNEDLDKLTLVLLAAIAIAHRRVWIMTPYFIPGDVLIAALQSAALRGVEVAIILPARSDQAYVDWAARKSLEQLLPRQVRVWYQPAPFAHTKLFLVDGYYAQVGSANMDRRSLRLNFELNFEVYDSHFVEHLAAHFNTLRSRSMAVTEAALKSRKLPERLRDACCWLFSPYL